MRRGLLNVRECLLGTLFASRSALGPNPPQRYGSKINFAKRRYSGSDDSQRMLAYVMTTLPRIPDNPIRNASWCPKANRYFCRHLDSPHHFLRLLSVLLSALRLLPVHC
ncbi:hypothetical protein MIND_01393200 [Mycena indigotica]|uniref:Uncharacterized protein n=1 Tax=Mycena indigotica TaxID=2126181 RepID=A0A8H6RZ22_9AGAR|nr:uncharacterized protein MIND_01393200 [Mycena indigotica]KAF7289313.1 hypothetical protein MIND_01393200 [Mycena indigotica]